MNQVFAKVRIPWTKEKYRKIFSTSEEVYPGPDQIVRSIVPYDPQTLLDEGEWFVLGNFSTSPFTVDIVRENISSAGYDLLDKSSSSKIDYLFVENSSDIFFQNVGRSSVIQKRRITYLGNNFEFENEGLHIVINDMPDAIYSKKKDHLYFRKLPSITRIFKGIDQIYREATESETAEFLQQPFIKLKNDFNHSRVGVANRKRVALAEDTLKKLNESEKLQVVSYIGEYCPNLKSSNNSFEVGCEDDLKMVLFGIEQRFYTTPVGGEKRIANSVITIEA